jgi:hypothetical protein
LQWEVTNVTPRRLALWLLQHPLTFVAVLLTTLAILAVSTVRLVDRQPGLQPSYDGTGGAAYVLPSPTQRPPPNRVAAAHRALHDLHRACATPLLDRDPEQVLSPLDLIIRFAVDFPRGGFRMDDETGSTLGLLIIVWDAVKNCDPVLAPMVEELIPAEYLGR